EKTKFERGGDLLPARGKPRCAEPRPWRRGRIRAGPRARPPRLARRPSRSCGVDVRPELGGIRFGVAGSEIGSLGDDGTNLGFDLLEAFLGAELALEDAVPDLLDGVALGAHGGDLLPGAVFRRV